MVVQAIALLDDLDKELNIYAMRVKEWYGWHFPEMAKIINDNIAYARVILQMGMRTSASTADLAEVLPEEIEAAVKSAAEISMGTEITEEDLDNIQNLARQVVDFTEYRQQLSSYLSARMAAIAPNLTQLVGELVGARLIAHAGSLMNLAKSPASTIQILGAEKALFRALKTKHDTPKYGLIFHASLVGQATGRNKAKIARVLAAKAAIGTRVDALEEWGIEGEDPEHEPSEEKKAELGREARYKIERQLAKLEGKPIRAKGVAIGPNGVSTQPGKWEVKEARKYNKDADGLVGDEPAAAAAQPPPPAKKIEDVTPAVEPAISREVEMTNGNHDEDEDESMEDADSESEKEDEDEDDFDPYKLSSTLPKTKMEPSSSEPAVQPSNGLKESDSESSESEAEEIEETPEEKKRREKKERKRLKKEDEAKPETKEARAIAKECGLSLKRYRDKLSSGKIELGKDGKPTAQAKKDMRRHRREMKKIRKERKAEERARKKAERKQKKVEQNIKAQQSAKTPEERAEKKARKAEAKAAKLAKKAEKSSSKKRKRAEDGEAVAEKAEKKRKKREKAEAESA